MEWCLPASHNSSEPTGATQPSFLLTISGTLLRISGCVLCSCFTLVSHRGTLATSSTTVQLPHFGRHYILNLKSSITLCHMSSSEGPCQAILTFPPLWSVPSHGRPQSHQTVSPHSLPSQAPAPAPLTWPCLSCPQSFCCFWSFSMSCQGLGGIRNKATVTEEEAPLLSC